MTVTASGSALPTIADETDALRYELRWTRNTGGASSCAFVDTDTGTTLFSTTAAAWDDAIPWEAGTYRAEGMAGLKWAVGPDPAGRSLIRIHSGVVSDHSHGCLVAESPFLAKIDELIGDDAFRVVVQNDSPQSLSLQAARTTVQEGAGIELTVSMTRAASKDMWVKVELDESSVATAADVELDTSILTPLSDKTLYDSSTKLDGYYVHIAEGDAVGKLTFKTISDKLSEQPELARFSITDYAVSDDLVVKGKVKEEDYRFYRDTGKILIDKDHSKVDVTISDQVLPIQESGHSGNYPFTVSVTKGQQFTFSFEAYTIPDSLRIFDGSNILFSTSGQVSGHHSGTFAIAAGTTGTLTCVVDGNADSNTDWDFYLNLLASGTSSRQSLAHLSSASSRVEAVSAEATPRPAGTGSIAAGETGTHTFDGAAGHVYLVTVAAADDTLDPALGVSDSQGSFVTQQYDGVGTTTAFSYLTFSADEQVAVDVSGEDYSSGDYRIWFEDVTSNVQNVVSVAASFEQLEEAASAGIGGEGTIAIHRDGDLSRSLTVNWSIVPDASSGATAADVSGPMSGTVTFAGGEFSKLIDITAIADKLTEGRENFTFMLTGAGGASILHGADGKLADSAEFSIIDTAILPMRKTGTYASDYMEGGAKADTLRGSFGDDAIFGLGGNDSIFGDADADSLFGDDGADSIHGGVGDDRIFGDGFDPNALGIGLGSGLADLKTTVAVPTRIAASARAVLLSQGFSLSDSPDIADATSLPHVTVSRTGKGASDFYAISLSAGMHLNLDIDGTNGTGAPPFDGYLKLYDAAGNVVATADDSSTSAGAGGSTSGRDPLLQFDIATSGRYFIEVRAYGGGGVPAGATYSLHTSLAMPLDKSPDGWNPFTDSPSSDKLFGDAGNDSLYGGAGNDILTGGAGADKLSGGGGADTASYADARKAVIASLAKPSVNTSDAKSDSYSSIENLTGSRFGDTLTGNNSANRLDGSAGDDILIAAAGADKLFGGAGSDAASYATSLKKGVTASLAKPSVNTGDAEGDTFKSVENLAGSKFADKLTGNSGANTIKGGGGNDRLTGGEGADKLYGGDGKKGLGSDIFVFTKLSDSTAVQKGQDTIYDFASGDRFDLSAIDASIRKSGNQAFTFIGADKFHGKASELRYDKLKSDTYIYADVNGDKKADFAFHLDDAVKLVKADFLL